MPETKIDGNCPECKTSSLLLRENVIYCSQCNKDVMTEFPETAKSKEEITRAFENWIQSKQSD